MYPELTPLPAEGATGSNNLHILITLHPDPPLEKVAYTMPESVFVEFFFL
jgi:hypothetical protein